LGFILKCVLILLVFSFIVYVLKAITRLSAHLRGTIKDVKTIRDRMGTQPTASANMVRCASCGAFVASNDAITVSSRNRAQTFCSQECISLHAKSV